MSATYVEDFTTPGAGSLRDNGADGGSPQELSSENDCSEAELSGAQQRQLTTTTTIVVVNDGEPTPPNMAEPSPEELWQQIQDAINSWHFQPDFQAVQIILAFEASYQISKSDHLWLHLVGPSSSGKTSLGIAMLDELFPDHHQLGEITPNTFLSGLTRGKQKGKMNSFLHQIGGRGLVYAPDFTNFLSNDDMTVGRVAGQLREIYDGKITKRVGSSDQVNQWEGELGFITAFTPSKEYAWHKHNREGERFLTMRWHGVEPRGEEEEALLGRLMKRQDKKECQVELRRLVKQLLELGKEEEKIHGLTTPDTNNIEDRSYKLARLVGKLRTLPIRSDGKNISHVAGEEGPGRVFKQLIKVARGWSSIMRRTEVDVEDWTLAERLAIDTIPETRRWLLESLPWGGGDSVTRPELLLEMTPFHGREALEWHLQDLLALGVVGMNEAREVWLKDKFVELAEAGSPGWVAGLRENRDDLAAEALLRLEQKEFGVMR